MPPVASESVAGSSGAVQMAYIELPIWGRHRGANDLETTRNHIRATAEARIATVHDRVVDLERARIMAILEERMASDWWETIEWELAEVAWMAEATEKEMHEKEAKWEKEEE